MSGTSGLRLHGHTSAGDGGAISPSGDAATTTFDGTASGSPETNVQDELDRLEASDAAAVDISDDAADITAVNFAEQGSNPASPAASHRILFTKSGGVYAKDSSGNVTGPLIDGSSALTPSSIIIPGATSPAQTAEGSAVWDTDDDKLTVGTGAGRKTLVNEGGSLSLLGAPTGDFSIGSHKLTNVTDPTSAQDAATKAYADGLTGAAVAVKDEGSTLTAGVASVDFVGAGVTATNVGTAVTVTVPGGSGSVASDAIFDAKGDLAVGTGADTAAKLTAGANDTILMAESGETTGLKWVASQTPSTQAFSDAAAEGTADTFARGDHVHGMPASPGGSTFSGCRLYRNASYTLGNTATFVWDAEVYDTDAYHDNSTDPSHITIPATGYYSVVADISADGLRKDLYKNGSQIIFGIGGNTTAGTWHEDFGVLALTAGDYLELYNPTATVAIDVGSAVRTWISVTRVG